MARLSLPPLQELCDLASNGMVSSTTDLVLNGKLYAKALLSLDEQALQNVVSHTHLWANGVLLLQESAQSYKPKCVHKVIGTVNSGPLLSIYHLK